MLEVKANSLHLHSRWFFVSLSFVRSTHLSEQKKNPLMQEYSSSKSTMDELYKIRKNYRIYMGKEKER